MNSEKTVDSPEDCGLKSGLHSEQLLTLAMDFGEQMIVCGAEANRVEDTISRICTAYGCVRVDVFSITSFVSATILTPDGHRITQSRRIYSYSNDLDRLEYLNAVSRCICEKMPAYGEIEKSIAHLHKDRQFPSWIQIISYMVSSCAFAIFFGGTLLDGFVSLMLSIPAYFSDKKVKNLGLNRLLYFFGSTFILGILASTFSYFGMVDNLDKVVIGLVMLYIPGLQMTNSIRDMLCGDIMSGLLRLIEAIILAISIAGGFASSIQLFGALFGR